MISGEIVRAQVLDDAKRCVCNDRQNQYGDVEDNFNLIADLWSTYTGIGISAMDVAMMMVLLKVARVSSGTAKYDSFVDIAGYAACGAEVVTPAEVEDAGKQSDH